MLDKLMQICKEKKMKISINYRSEMIFVIDGYKEFRGSLKDINKLIEKLEKWFELENNYKNTKKFIE